MGRDDGGYSRISKCGREVFCAPLPTGGESGLSTGTLALSAWRTIKTVGSRRQAVWMRR